MTDQIPDRDVQAAMTFGEQMLDFLVDSYPKFVENDLAEGAVDDFGALGGIGMLAEKAVQTGPTTPEILLALAVRRLAKASKRDEILHHEATIRLLKATLDQAEEHVEERDQRIADLAADLLEVRAQRAELATEVERLRKELNWQTGANP